MTFLSNLINEIFELLVQLLFSAVVIFLAFLLIQQSVYLPVKSRTYLNNDVNEHVIGGVQGENIVQQTFRASVPISQVEVRLATFDRINPGNVYFRIFDSASGFENLAISVPAKDIVDNSYYQLVLDKPLESQTTYTLEISGQTPNLNESIGVWSSFTNVYKKGQLTVSDYKTEGDIAFRLIAEKPVSYKTNILLSCLYFFLIAAVIWGYIIYQRKFANSFWDAKGN